MNTRFPPRTVQCLLALALWTPALRADPAGTEEQAIRATRSAFNTAIAERNADAIPGFLAPEYHIVSSRNHQVHGKRAERQTWSDWFAADPTARCQRDTLEIKVNTRWGQAQEMGDWTCWFRSEGGPTEASGVYVAKWQQATDGRWLILTEVFTALACTGGENSCIAPDTIDIDPQNRR